MIAIIPGMAGYMEFLVIGFIALLLFGNRLPGVARSLGQGIVEFKRGLRGDKKKEALPGGDGDKGKGEEDEED